MIRSNLNWIMAYNPCIIRLLGPLLYFLRSLGHKITNPARNHWCSSRHVMSSLRLFTRKISPLSFSSLGLTTKICISVCQRKWSLCQDLPIMVVSMSSLTPSFFYFSIYFLLGWHSQYSTVSSTLFWKEICTKIYIIFLQLQLHQIQTWAADTKMQSKFNVSNSSIQVSWSIRGNKTNTKSSTSWSWNS